MIRFDILVLRAALLLVLPSLATAQAPSGEELAPRHAFTKTPVSTHTSAMAAKEAGRGDTTRILVKFHDSVKARAEAGGLLSAVGADVSTAQALAADFGATFLPGFDIGQARLEALQARAQVRSQRVQPDLSGLLELLVDEAVSTTDRIAMAEAFQSLEVVEFATVMSPPLLPEDIAPLTLWMVFLQTYRHSDPGIDVDFAWEQDLRGEGVRVSDVEFAWNADHEDLVGKPIHSEPGQTPTPMAIADGLDHGTAVLGELVSIDNAYGCSGMVPEVSVYTYPVLTIEAGFRGEDAIAAAVSDTAEGDIVLLELQTSALAPVETDLPVFLIVQVATDAGVVVVAAAGNGNKNLDGNAFAAYKSWGDSGAILVGGGTSTVLHAKKSTSNFGSRVNVQGWAENVFSLGYGNFAEYASDPNQRYTQIFNGTSSASPFVVAAAAILQQRAKESLLAPLDPLVLRQHLIDTGIPQGGTGGHIGPFPDVKAALQQLPTPWTVVAASLAGPAGTPVIGAKGLLEAETPLLLTLAEAPAGGLAWLVAGTSLAMAPFKKGTLVPTPDTLLGPFLIGADGALTLAGTWPAGIPPLTTLVAQWWTDDGTPHLNLAASDGVVGTTP
jgi:hypothetical protein